MCDTSRRSLLLGAAALTGLRPSASGQQAAAADPAGKRVYFHEGDIAKEGHCING
jgi:hypothetical protein